MLSISRYLEVARRGLSPSHLAASAPSRYGAGARPPVVVWNLTQRCNQSCAHCYASATTHPSPDELDTAACRRVLHEMADASVPVVIFSGGEPLLRKDLLELVTLASELGVRPQLSSNGTLADVARLEPLEAAGLGYFGVSIDGQPGFNDVFRGMHRGHARAVKGLEAARAVGLRTGLRMTVTRRNSGDVPAMLELAEAVGATRFYVSHLIEVGRGSDVDALPPARTRELLLDLFELALAAQDGGREVQVVTGGNESAGPLFVDWLARRCGPEAAATVRRLLEARGGNSSGVGILNIDHDGLVHPDQFWRSAVLGDLKTQPFADVLEHPLRQQLARRAELLGGRCGDCRFVSLCGGGHRERALARLGDAWGADPGCVMTDSEILPPSIDRGLAAGVHA